VEAICFNETQFFDAPMNERPDNGDGKTCNWAG